MGWMLAIIGLAGFVVAAFALARGFSWKPAAILLLASWLALFEGGTLASNAAEQAAPQPSPTPIASPSPSSSPSPIASPSPTRPQSVPATATEGTVGRTIDGATFVVTGAGLPPAEQTVRLLGVDVPLQAACYGPEATEFLGAGLIKDSKVYLLAGKPDKDSKGALLRYVWTAQGDFVNEAIAREGMGKAAMTAATDPLATRIQTAGKAAQDAGAGLWTECAPKPKAATAPKTQAQQPAVVAPPDDTCTNCGRSPDPEPTPTPDDDLESLLPNHDGSGSSGDADDEEADPSPEPSPIESPDPVPSPDISPLGDIGNEPDI